MWRVCTAEDLLPTAREHATLLARRPISPLVAVKRTMTEPHCAAIRAAGTGRTPPAELDGRPGQPEALTAFAEGGLPDFSGL